MRCPYCESTNGLVWDVNRGTVVCSVCGTVLDSIYVGCSAPEHEYEDHSNEVGKCSSKGAKAKKLSEASLKYLEILREIKYRPMLYIDSHSFNRYLVLGKRVKVVRRKEDLPKNEVLDVIISLMSKYPKLCSRTDRAKYAIATIAYTLVTKREVDTSKLSKELGISKTHIRRLMKVINNSQKFLDEVRRSISTTSVTLVPR